MKDKDKKDLPKLGKFQYFDEDFYGFLSTTARGNLSKKVRFKNKVIKDFTPETAFLVKKYIDTAGFKYDPRRIKALLGNHNNVQLIINTLLKNKKI